MNGHLEESACGFPSSRKGALTFERVLRKAALSAALVALTGIGVAGCGDDEPDNTAIDFNEIGRCDDFNPLKTPYFGDTHVHTRFSLDANLQGTDQTVRDAYRFARGEELGIQPFDADGNPMRTIQLDRPLDFTMVSDHAEFFGLTGVCEDPESEQYVSQTCTGFRETPANSFISLNFLLAATPQSIEYPAICGFNNEKCSGAIRSMWEETQDAAEEAYDRTSACSFTSFIGYEWTGNPQVLNLHRNIVFRNGNVTDQPFSYFDEPTPEGLWAALRANCLEAEPGDEVTPQCDVLTIPHNSNLSNGRMFEEQMDDGSPLDAAYVEERAAMEPLVEIFQHKGSSECLPGTLTGDEECDFEILPYGNLSQPVLGRFGTPNPVDFIRYVLGRGFAVEEQFGTNPFKYGIIASTDTHIAAAGGVSEIGFPGNGGAGIDNSLEAAPIPDIIEFNPGGLAVIWAEENSRPALFDAMRNKETYGTSGPRITLRFFGGWEADAAICDASAEMFAQHGYDSGVPMGGTISSPPTDVAPTFTVSAVRDAGTETTPGTQLQRIQIVKGWLNDEGEPVAETYDVAGDADNGAGVDVNTCETSGDGFDSLCGTWTDPDFDPAQRAWYYARVLENPTCRWATRQCNALAPDCSDPEALEKSTAQCCRDTWSRTIQERAWSSPIWFSPDGDASN